MTRPAQHDAHYMARALELARTGWGQTHPNPMVGALVVHDDVVLAEGWHAQAGGAHAEIVALRALEEPSAARSATLYVTLEPCSTVGRTGACTDAIIETGFKRVVIGALDPNPAHAGRGVALLREAGIEVTTGILEADCTDLNLVFNHWIVHQGPFFAAKMALTIDGKFAAASGHARWVTGAASRADVMRWRRYFPAIAVSAKTVLADDPSLTSRQNGAVFCPRRLVLDRGLRTMTADPLPQLFTDRYREQTVLVCLDSADPELQARARSLGIALWTLPGRAGQIDWEALREACAAAGLVGLYIECGPGLATSLLEQRLVDYLFLYQAPKFMADAATPGIGSNRQTIDMDEAINLRSPQHRILGEDVLTRGYLSR